LGTLPRPPKYLAFALVFLPLVPPRSCIFFVSYMTVKRDKESSEVFPPAPFFAGPLRGLSCVPCAPFKIWFVSGFNAYAAFRFLFRKSPALIVLQRCLPTVALFCPRAPRIWCPTQRKVFVPNLCLGRPWGPLPFVAAWKRTSGCQSLPSSLAPLECLLSSFSISPFCGGRGDSIGLFARC